MPGPSASAQRAAVTEFTSITQADKNFAARLLKQHGWNVGAAVNAHYSAQSLHGNPAITAFANALFDKYRDQPDNHEANELNMDGAALLLEDLSIDLGGIAALAFHALVEAPSLGRITRDPFLALCHTHNITTLPRLRTIVTDYSTQLPSNPPNFKRVYEHAFQLALLPGQKALPLEIATEFWRTLFSPDGLEWQTPVTPWLDWWLEFMESRWKKAVNKDLWKQTLLLARETLKDDNLAFWSEEASWPSVIDDFVEWVRSEKRAGAGGDMEVE